MNRDDRGVFAGRGIRRPTFVATAIAVLVAFGAGIAVGWGTGLFAERLATPETTPSPTPSATATPTMDVSLPPMEPVTRLLEESDVEAGLNSLEVVVQGEGTFTSVTSEGTPTGDTASVRWVRIEYEDGLDMNARGLSQFILAALNDPRGWGARGRFEFVPTAGAPDLRIVVASPHTAAATCPHPHQPANVGAEVSSSTSPTPTPTADAADVSCADQGLIMLSQYDWIAGLPGYGDEYSAARVYLVNHGVGHVMGDEDGICASGRALIMTDQRDLPEECEPNPWPWPEEPLPSPSPTPTPSGDPAARPEDG